MKKILIVCFIVGIVFAFSTNSYAGWELYDDFNSGQIDTQKWEIQESSTAITVENGRVKFVHQEGNANDNSWLIIIQNPETVIGIKAEITVVSCQGDVRARVSGYAGKIGVNNIWSSLQFKASDQRIYSEAGLEGPPPNLTWGGNLFWVRYPEPIAMLGNTFNCKMMFENDKITYEVAGLGKMTYRYSSPKNPADIFFRGVGTKSENGDGPCTVYFDDVYVFRP